MIPKIIHYCWFGKNPLPEETKEFIESWKKYCPQYKIIEWNEDNFDINKLRYTKEAYEHKKWAFITEYVRLYALYYYGGIYMYTDVEVTKPLDCFLEEQGFSGFEMPDKVPTGLMACEKGHPFIKEILDKYDEKRFVLENGKIDLTTNVELITAFAIQNGLLLNNKKQTILNFTFYPTEYFCPKNNRTLELQITENTFAIHHFAGSWISSKNRYNQNIKKLLGPRFTALLLKLTDKFKIT